MSMSVASIASGYRSSIRVNQHNHARALCPACHAVLGGSVAFIEKTRLKVSVYCGAAPVFTQDHLRNVLRWKLGNTRSRKTASDVFSHVGPSRASNTARHNCHWWYIAVPTPFGSMGQPDQTTKEHHDACKALTFRDDRPRGYPTRNRHTG